MEVLHPDNKISYTNNQPVEVMVGDKIYSGKIIGQATSSNIIDWWIVMFDQKFEGYEFSAFSIQHTAIRPKGDNRPFLCEGVSRV